MIRAASILALAAVAALLWLWAGAGEPDLPAVALDDARPRPQGDFYRGAWEEPHTLNPFIANDATAARVVLPWTHDALMDRDPASGALRPALAERAVAEPGRLRFTLRRDLVFADGEPVRADDVHFTFAMARDPACAAGRMAIALRDVTELVVDGREIEFTVPTAAFTTLPRVACEFRIVQRAYFERAIAALGSQGSPERERGAFAREVARLRLAGPGTGPLRVAELADGTPWWRAHRDLVLVQNARCWRRAAAPETWNLAGVAMRFDTDPAARFTMLRNLELDWFAGEDDLAGVSREDPLLRAEFERHVYDPAALGPYFVMWNLRDAVLGDARVRRALGMAFDREQLAGALLGGLARPAASWFRDPAQARGMVEPQRFDPAAARALLVSAGHSGGLDIELLVARERDVLRRIAEFAAPGLAEAGVRLSLQLVDFANLVARLDAGQFEGALLLKLHEPEIDPFEFFHGSTVHARRMGLADVELDTRLEAARVELDDARRREHMAAFERWFAEQQPVTLLVQPRAQVLLHRRFEGVELGVGGLSPERWWVDPARRVVGR